ncbi:MAG: hypothetical protein HC866_22640 [Leptolyngbyaceae cyanobacterium RU_5_1]|nr:hypothetical protein [Leptolyngbyaceae cyanobacterium RU_5_1]
MSVCRLNPLYTQLAETISPEGRAKTATKLNQHVVEFCCGIASVQTNGLYTYMQNVMDLQEVKRIAEASLTIYSRLIQLYQQDLLRITSDSTAKLLTEVRRSHPDFSEPANLSDIEQLSRVMEPVLLQFQAEHTQAKDWRTLGFITTQLNFCNQWIINQLTPLEQILLTPYLMFIEEQVAHPWHRVCAAAARYPSDSPVLTLLETMIPMCQQIAERAYYSLAQLLPNHCSRRGKLTNPGVTHSCVRDFKMFQAYLWLCVLEESLVPVEQELLTLCVMVLPSVGVSWTMTELWTQVLADELIHHLEPSQQQYVLTYMTGIHQAFLDARVQLDIPLAS